MKIIFRFILGAILVSGAIAAEPSLNKKSAYTPPAPPVSAVRKTGPQVGPIVGGMLEDGREVPARFRGLETKEQKARRQQQQEQDQQEPEEQ